MVLSLIPWGYVVDQRGERFVLVTGLVGTTVAGLVAASVHSTPALGFALFVAGPSARAATRRAGASSSAGPSAWSGWSTTAGGTPQLPAP
ncbi:MAG: hypothetical protein ACR2FG_06080 [Marmoricola sp.]